MNIFKIGVKSFRLLNSQFLLLSFPMTSGKVFTFCFVRCNCCCKILLFVLILILTPLFHLWLQFFELLLLVGDSQDRKREMVSCWQGWKMYRTTGPMVPENFWVYQKIFRSKKELLARHKDKFLIGRKYIELENEKNWCTY